LVAEIKDNGGDAVAFEVDVADFGQVKVVADGAAQHFGRIDTWVNFAATAVYAEFKDTTPDEFHRIINVNLVGQAYGAMAALPHLRRTGRGALIFISSVESHVSLPYHSAYAASKHGMNGFIDALRLELRHEQSPIRVTTIMPTGVNTPFFNNARTKLGVKPRPPQPIYEPEHVAETVLYAAEHGADELYVGGAAKMFAVGKRWMPHLLDTYLLKTMFQGQRTKEPKSSEAPSGMFRPETGDSRVHGDFTPISRKSSAYVWLQTHPIACSLIKGAAVLAATATLKQWCEHNCRPTLMQRTRRTARRWF
jgi:NAD(P)-dependent dehydrogenase (short-subunit alcohol dehydrogenase family)